MEIQIISNVNGNVILNLLPGLGANVTRDEQGNFVITFYDKEEQEMRNREIESYGHD